MNFLDKWNKAKFTVYDSEEKTVLKLVNNINNFVGELSKGLDEKTDIKGNHEGSWQGLSRPTLSDEGMRATVENMLEETKNIKENVSSLNVDNIANKKILENIALRYKNKNITFVGDSITVGFVDRPFPLIVGENLNANIINLGVSGSAITVVGGRTDSFFERKHTIPQNSDLILIFGGTNDFGHDSPMGNNFTISTDNFYGSLIQFIEYVLSSYPNSKLAFITPLHREGEYMSNAYAYALEDYVEVIKDCCKHYGIPYLDLYNDLGINPNISSHKTLYMNDGLHPNELCHEIIATKITDFIRRI